MAIILRQGLDTAQLPDRLSFLVEHRFLWLAGWLTWNLAAIAILVFYFCFAQAHEENSKYDWLLQLAILLTGSGVAIDFGAEAIEMGVLPNLAQMSVFHSGNMAATSTEIFLSLHRTAVMMTGCLANELYTISAALLIFATRDRYSWLIKTPGCLVVASGTWLSIACLLNSVSGMMLSNILLLPMLIIWQLGIAYQSKLEARSV